MSYLEEKVLFESYLDPSLEFLGVLSPPFALARLPSSSQRHINTLSFLPVPRPSIYSLHALVVLLVVVVVLVPSPTAPRQLEGGAGGGGAAALSKFIE